MSSPGGLRLFLSYSHVDEPLLNELRKQLANLIDEGIVLPWHDREIRPGAEWEPAIFEELDNAEIIVLLLSADFIASQFCRKVELQRALQRHHANKARIVPIVVRPIEALPKELTGLQGLPRDLKPITSFKSHDDGYALVARELRSECEQLLRERSGTATPTGSQTRPARFGSSPLVLLDERPVPLYLELDPGDGGYSLVARLGHQHEQVFQSPEPARLAKAETVQLPDGHSLTLGTLSEGLASTAVAAGSEVPREWLGERGQLEIGRKLFRETVGRLGPVANCDQVDLRILTDYEYLLTLPWQLLNRGGIFLARAGWSISLASRREPLSPVAFPARCRTLVVAPEPLADGKSIGANEHVDDIRSLIRRASLELGADENFAVARTWPELETAVATGPFDVVYYFGHSLPDADGGSLVFESAGPGEQRAPDSRRASQVANLLRKLTPAPRGTLLNTLQPDSSGLLGLARQLAAFIPCVVAQRRAVPPAAARKLGLEFLRQLLVDRAPPQAIATTIDLVVEQAASASESNPTSSRWFAPLHYANFSQWRAESPPTTSTQKINPDWPWLLDRKTQYSITTQQLREITGGQKIGKRGLAIVVYGAEGNGLTHFQQRIKRCVHEHVGVDGNVYQPSWAAYAPRDSQDRALAERSFSHVVESLGQASLRDLSRDFRRGVPGREVLTVFNHSLVTKPETLNSRRLFEYLQWWEHNLKTQVDDPNAFFLLAFYFQIPAGHETRTKFLNAMKAARRETKLDAFDVELLPPLTEIDDDDLLQFISDHKLFIPDDKRAAVAKQIIALTRGQYEESVRKLELVVNDRYHELLKRADSGKPSDDENSW